MRWRIRIGHYEPTTVVTLEDGRISPAFESEEFQRRMGRKEKGIQGLPKPLQGEFAPEPDLLLDGETVEDEGPKLVFLTTNPGRGNDYQGLVHSGGACESSYQLFQARMVGCHYRPGVLKGAAGTRIKRMREIARELCRRRQTLTSSFLQCEMVPFHSGDLPDKPNFVPTAVIEEYWEALRIFLADHHVIAIDGAHLHGGRKDSDEKGTANPTPHDLG